MAIGMTKIEKYFHKVCCIYIYIYCHSAPTCTFTKVIFSLYIYSLYKGWCQGIIVPVCRHGRKFAHWTDMAKAVVMGKLQPVFRIPWKRKLEQVMQVSVNSRIMSNLLLQCQVYLFKQH